MLPFIISLTEVKKTLKQQTFADLATERFVSDTAQESCVAKNSYWSRSKTTYFRFKSIKPESEKFLLN